MREDQETEGACEIGEACVRRGVADGMKAAAGLLSRVPGSGIFQGG